MHRVDIKPLSVNEAWKGRRFKTPAHKRFRRDLGYMLPNGIDIPEGKLEIEYTFRFSSKRADYDNAIKSFQDALCDKYGFDDSQIYRATITKEIVPRGSESISFSIKKLTETN